MFHFDFFDFRSAGATMTPVNELIEFVFRTFGGHDHCSIRFVGHPTGNTKLFGFFTCMGTKENTLDFADDGEMDSFYVRYYM